MRLVRLMAGSDGRKAERPARRDKASPDRYEKHALREQFPKTSRISQLGDPRRTSYPNARP